MVFCIWTTLRGATKITTKLVILALLGGMFEWIWIGAAIASVYFLYGALANDAPWSNLFWSIGAAFVARYLAAALTRYKRREEYVDQLIRRGYPRTEAREAWRTAINGGLNLLRNLQQEEKIEETNRPATERDNTNA